MEVKNLFDPAVKQEIIERISKLRPATQRLWGSMDVAQMLSHLQKPIGVAYGTHMPKGSFLLKLLGPMFKSSLYNSKPYRKGLPTDKTFIIADKRDFDKEKQELLSMIDRFAEENITDGPHPIFGKLTKEQWSMAMWKHTDHHLRQFGV